MKNRSLAAPVLLIGLGVLFLISNVMPEVRIWDILEYWPVLLILFGLIRLGEVLTAAQRGTLYQDPRPLRSGGGGFGWIIALVIFGLLLSIPRHIRHERWQWGPIRAGGVEFLGQDFDYPVTVTTQAGGAHRLVLDNFRGAISIQGSDDNEVRIQGHKVIRAYDQKAADQANDQSRIQIAPEGDAIYLRTSDSTRSSDSRLSLNLEISVPAGFNIESRGRLGDLSVNSIHGSVNASGQRGEIRLSEIGGNARLDLDRSDLLRATDVKGTVDLSGSGRDIQLEDIGGQVTVNGSFSGTLDFRNLAQPFHFESNQTDFRITKLPGTINMDLRELRASGVEGPFRFVTHSRDVHMDSFTGPLEIKVDRGDIDLKPEKTPLARMDVKTDRGNVDLALPGAAKFDLRAETSQGEVSNDYGDVLDEISQGKAATLKSKNPSGAPLVITTNRGQISVRRSD